MHVCLSVTVHACMRRYVYVSNTHVQVPLGSVSWGSLLDLTPLLVLSLQNKFGLGTLVCM